MRTFLLPALAAFFAAGCASTTAPTPVDWNFGKAVNAAKAAQIIDPDAATRRRAAMTTDGRSARSSIELYEKSFQSPPPPLTILNIGTGGSSSGSGGGSR